MSIKVKGSIDHTIIPLSYDLNNPMSGFNNWQKYLRIETNKLYGVNAAGKHLRMQHTIKHVTENPESIQDMRELVDIAKQLINK